MNKVFNRYLRQNNKNTVHSVVTYSNVVEFQQHRIPPKAKKHRTVVIFSILSYKEIETYISSHDDFIEPITLLVR